MRRFKHNLLWAIVIGLVIGFWLAIISHGAQPLFLAVITVYFVWVIFETRGFTDLVDGYAGRRPRLPDDVEQIYFIQRIALSVLNVIICISILTHLYLQGLDDPGRLCCAAVVLIFFIGLPTLAWVLFYMVRKAYQENPPVDTPRHW